MKLFLARLLTYLFFRLHIYRLLSLLHRRLFDYKLPPGSYLPKVSYFVELVSILKEMRWRPDGLKDFGDAFCTAEQVWINFCEDPDKFVGDCDDFAVFICTVLMGSWTRFKEGWLSCHIITVAYQREDGSFGGHNVAGIARFKPGTMEEQYGYMDYGMPEWYATKQELATAIRHRYGGVDSKPVLWAVTDYEDLKPLEVYWGK